MKPVGQFIHSQHVSQLSGRSCKQGSFVAQGTLASQCLFSATFRVALAGESRISWRLTDVGLGAAAGQAHDTAIPAQQAPSRASREDSPVPDPAQASPALAVPTSQTIHAVSIQQQQQQQQSDKHHSTIVNPEESQEVHQQHAALAPDQPTQAGMASQGADAPGSSQRTQPSTYDMMGGVMPGSPHRHTRTSAPYSSYGPWGYNPAMTSMSHPGPPGMPPPGMQPPAMQPPGPGQLHSSGPMPGPQSLPQPMGGPQVASQPMQPYGDPRGDMVPSSRSQMQQPYPSHPAYHPT